MKPLKLIRGYGKQFLHIQSGFSLLIHWKNWQWQSLTKQLALSPVKAVVVVLLVVVAFGSG